MDQTSKNRTYYKNNNNNKIETLDNLILINKLNIIIIGKMEERKMQENIKREQEID